MSTATPRPNASGPGTPAPRSGVPLPGQHLPGAAGQPEPADPERIRADIRDLLAELVTSTSAQHPADIADPAGGADLARRAHILEQAHDVLVQALATVDKI
ncbi:hypothetical protein [Nocardia donostiensis]|uniref:Uncharacterized protein n=2 Tax=Nocardia donostiensis TaxID=1538463 RepID=A0A1V2TGW8_9NOCA|nr:hypothetical protein [Nocardia donostiensis]ONM48759.1 hypothetical protein B0T46_09635 [Nocardia donostiensis]OQS13043.1 hypothetical protein B0T36_22325 [Nocardia donostiensis]